MNTPATLNNLPTNDWHHPKADGQLAGAGRRTPMTQHDKLTQQARQWLGLTFFAPVLKQARESPFHSKVLDGGSGGQAFGSMFDQQIAQHMTRGTGSKLVNGIVRRLEGRKAYAKQNASAQTQEKLNMNSEREGADRVPSLSNLTSNRRI